MMKSIIILMVQSLVFSTAVITFMVGITIFEFATHHPVNGTIDLVLTVFNLIVARTTYNRLKTRLEVFDV